MKVSASIEMIWKLAVQEAIAADFKEIELEHFFAALLRFSELPVEGIGKIADGADAARQLAAEVRTVGEELFDRSIDGAQVRRTLRTKLGKGSTPFDGGELHRSQTCRQVFDAAGKKADDAGSETLMPIHLLQAIMESPSSLIIQSLGGVVKPGVPRQSKTPQLDEVGQNLNRLAADGKFPNPADRQAEAKAVLETLAEKERKSVLLVSDGDDKVRVIVQGVAHAMVRGLTPTSLKGKRVVELSAVQGHRFTSVLAEVAAAGDVILFLTAPMPPGSGVKGVQWIDDLKPILSKGSLQCICRIDVPTYHDRIEKDATWKRLAHVVWVRDMGKAGVPTEL